MDSIHRKELKTDKFAEEVVHSVDFLSKHKPQATKYGIIALAILFLGGAYWLFTSRQATARTAALADALRISDAVVSPAPNPPNLNFASQDLKDAALTAAYTKVAEQYKGSQEGAMAQIYLASMKAEKGDLDAAAKEYQTAIDSAPALYASIAKLALAEIYAGQNKTAEAEKLLHALIDSPTAFVSKEQATLALGKILSSKNPAEARALLEPLRQSRTPISRQAIALLGALPASPVTPTP